MKLVLISRVGLEMILKFRFSEKDTKIWSNLPKSKRNIRTSFIDSNKMNGPNNLENNFALRGEEKWSCSESQVCILCSSPTSLEKV